MITTYILYIYHTLVQAFPILIGITIIVTILSIWYSTKYGYLKEK